MKFSTEHNTTAVIDVGEQPQSGPLADGWRRLRRNKAAVLGLLILVLSLLTAIFADAIAPMPYDKGILADSNSVPPWVVTIFPTLRDVEQGGYATISLKYPLGADALGRDLFSRIVYGARISLLMAFIGATVSMSIGLLVGVTAGYIGGRVDNLLMRFVDIMFAFPSLLFIILLMTFFRLGASDIEPGTLAYYLGELDRGTGGLLLIFVGIGLTSWMSMARLARGQVLAVRKNEYVAAAHAIGATNVAIMARHIVPNILGPLVVAETLSIPTYILYEAFLSYIGLGVNPPMPSWGLLIAEGARNIQTYPNQALFPAAALFLVTFAFNFLGDGLRDAMDPRMQGRD